MNNNVVEIRFLWKQRVQKYLRQFHNTFIITNKLSLQLEALSNCDNFTGITILQ